MAEMKSAPYCWRAWLITSRVLTPMEPVEPSTVTLRASIGEVREKTFRVDHEVSVGERHCATGFEVRAWVAQPDEPGGRLHAKALPIEVATKLKGQGGAYA